MRLAYIDFETFYDADYSLRKMTTAEYILDPRYETLGASVMFDDEDPQWIDGPAFGAWADKQDWSQLAMVSHNTTFDGGVLSFRYGKRPALYVDTLSMSRAILQHKLASLSLDSVTKYLNLGIKGTAILQTKGVRFAQLVQNPTLYRDFVAYAHQDNVLCRALYKTLRPDFPREEGAIVDMILRMFTQPQLQLDVGALNLHLQNVKRDKQALLDRLGFSDNEALMSNDKFAAALQAAGVEPPRKISATTGKETWAFSKNDQGFKELSEHEDPEVQALVTARLGHKSTLEETRTEKLIRIGLQYPRWPDRAPWMPMPLRYSGAHTHRLSGSDGLNVQNFPRGGAIRKAIKAPAGTRIVTADLSQIEARIVCWLAGAKMLDVFARGEDPYAYQAIQIGAMPPGLAKDDPKFKHARQLGKGCVLGCGFGMGPPKFQLTVARPPYNLTLSLDEAQRAVYGYRNSNPEVPQLWRTLQHGLQQLARRGHDTYVSGRIEMVRGLAYETDGKTVLMRLPCGLALKYEDLRLEGDQMWFDYAGRRQYVYGGKATENLVQALARCVIMEAAMRVRRETGFNPALQVHDENVYVVPEHHVDAFKEVVQTAMTASPVWAPDLPVATEVNDGENYGESK